MSDGASTTRRPTPLTTVSPHQPARWHLSEALVPIAFFALVALTVISWLMRPTIVARHMGSCDVGPDASCMIVTSQEKTRLGRRDRMNAIVLWRPRGGCDTCGVTPRPGALTPAEHRELRDSEQPEVGEARGITTLRIGSSLFEVPPAGAPALVVLVERDSASPSVGYSIRSFSIDPTLDSRYWTSARGSRDDAPSRPAMRERDAERRSALVSTLRRTHEIRVFLDSAAATSRR